MSLTAHQLAVKLLDGPDLPVYTDVYHDEDWPPLACKGLGAGTDRIYLEFSIPDEPEPLSEEEKKRIEQARYTNEAERKLLASRGYPYQFQWRCPADDKIVLMHFAKDTTPFQLADQHYELVRDPELIFEYFNGDDESPSPGVQIQPNLWGVTA